MIATKTLTLRIFYVYVLFDWRGWPFYVGKGKGKRWREHACRCNLSRNNAKNLIIRETLDRLNEIPAIKIAERLTHREALDLERLFIKEIGRAPLGPLANATGGGEAGGGRSLTEAEKAHLRSLWKGKAQTPAAIARRAASLRGQKRSPEQRERIRQTRLGTTASLAARAKISASLRRRVTTDQTREKRRQFQLGRKASPETIAKLRASHLGHKPSAATQEKRAASLRSQWQDPIIREKRCQGQRRRRRREAIEKNTKAALPGQLELFAASEIPPQDVVAADISAPAGDGIPPPRSE